jgi:hypothetical protein
MIMELRHHKIKLGKWQEVREYFGRLAPIVERVGGLPPMKFFMRMAWSGGFALTWMREWESPAQMEAAYPKAAWRPLIPSALELGGRTGPVP